MTNKTSKLIDPPVGKATKIIDMLAPNLGDASWLYGHERYPFGEPFEHLIQMGYHFEIWRPTISGSEGEE